jgi:hypothetical protein
MARKQIVIACPFGVAPACRDLSAALLSGWLQDQIAPRFRRTNPFGSAFRVFGAKAYWSEVPAAGDSLHPSRLYPGPKGRRRCLSRDVSIAKACCLNVTLFIGQCTNRRHVPAAQEPSAPQS